MATLTYAYAESTVVVGPLAPYVEPHSYDLCAAHAERTTAPKGWAVVRLEPDPEENRLRTDDLEALANAVREAGRTDHSAQPAADGRRPHLRVVPALR